MIELTPKREQFSDYCRREANGSSKWMELQGRWPLKRTGERLWRHSAVPFSPRSVHETEYLDAIQGYFDLKKKNIIVKETNLCILFWRFMIRSETAQRPASREFPGVLPG